MYKIVKIHKADAFYSDRKEIIGLVGRFEKSKWQAGIPEGFVAGNFYAPNETVVNGDSFSEVYFYAVKVKEVE
jgi:hypothetical protein